MTDADLIRKQSERILELIEKNEKLGELVLEWQDWHASRTEQLNNAEARCTEYARKLKAIEDEVNNYQFDSATNLQNKIKTILTSSDSKDEENTKHQD